MRRRLLAFISMFGLCLLGLTMAESEARAARKNNVEAYRLPMVASPTRYEIYLEPNLKKSSFIGKETLNLQLTRATSSIWLNYKELKIHSANLSGLSGSNSKAAIILEPNFERVRLDFPRQLKPGPYTLTLGFTGTINDKLAGFYRSSFKDKEGKEHILAVTQMEPTDARRMFPCFDEPAYKAVYKLKVKIPSGYSAISNAAVQSEVTENNSKIISFAPTIKMSSYLVTLLVGEFECTEATKVNGVEIRVWSVKGKGKLGLFARDIAAKLLPYLESYFDLPYAWGKLDLVAIPDFSAGAMENPGAITFRETLLLVDPLNSSVETLQGLVSVTAHEMAHLWFGDLVTMAWWDDLWLNEAFATWMAVKATDAVMPEWNFLSHFALERLYAMRTDALVSTRPIQSPVKNPADALQMFDEITYAKGASILRMLELFVGELPFRQGIRAYMKEHALANATTADLWRALSKSTGENIGQLMNGWARQPGYPLVTISGSTKPGSFFIRQERFLAESSAHSNLLWSVPFDSRAVLANARESKPTQGYAKALLKEPKMLYNSGLNRQMPFVANAYGMGYYRVQYDSASYRRLLPRVHSGLLSGERFSLLGDQFVLALLGRVPVADYFDLVLQYRDESELTIWKILLGQLEHLDLFVEPQNKAAYKSFVRYLVSDIHTKLGWHSKPGESGLVKTIRSYILSCMGTIAEEPQAISQARDLFAKSRKEPNAVEPEVLDAVTEIVAFNGNSDDYETILRLFREAPTPEIEQRNLLALAAFRSKPAIEKTLSLVLDEKMRKPQSLSLLVRLLRREASKDRAWQFTKANWAKLEKRFPEQMLAGIAGAPDNFRVESRYLDLKTFFATHKVKAGESDVARMLERVRVNISQDKKSGIAINKWLAAWAKR